MVSAVREPDFLTSLDMFFRDNRCDGCSARATFHIRLASGKSLFMCGHHTRKSMDALVTSGAVITQMEEAE